MALTAAELVKADQEHLIHPLHHPVDNAEPVIYVRGRGATVVDIGGHEYLDGLSGLWNVNVGHGRAELAEAAAAQMKELAYFSGYVGSSNIPAITLANRLMEITYDNMQAVFFASGGAEANESAFKTARFYWKATGKPEKFKIISRQQGYHGVTLQAMSATGMGAYWKMFEPRVREVCTRHDVLLIADEVITGFCRTGRWFALAHWNVKPDMLSFAKGVTSGYLPLGGIIVSKAIKDAMDSVKPEDRWMHAYTYSAHPTCCAVGLKNLEIMTRERLWENAAKMGDRLYAGLKQTFGDHPNVGDIRGGKGLLAALELVEDRASKKNFAGDRKVAARLQAEMMKRGVVTRTRPAVGPHPSPGDAVFYAPPLVVTEGEIDRLIAVTRDAVKAVLGA